MPRLFYHRRQISWVGLRTGIPVIEPRFLGPPARNLVNLSLTWIKIFLWLLQVVILLLLLINQVLLGHVSGKPQIEAEDSRTAEKIKKKRLRRLCSLLATGREDLDPEARTLLFIQVQQIQGSPFPLSGGYTAENALDCHSLGGSGGSGSHFGGGGLQGSVLGGLLGPILGGGGGGLLGNPQSDLNPGVLEDVVVRPEKYLRPIYRTFRPLVRLFKKWRITWVRTLILKGYFREEKQSCPSPCQA